ncbi:MAG TPA: AbrB/MazE/SpoVT family DNA-binding domain-containing protein [Candidatus Acidoferrales bacterium]|nr:AbrB/MazE/SpoVT family DNA-binding domain-containing protein [Candidatus Acidoferrales bacterium]
MATHRATLEYLTTTKIGEKGQLTVPKQFRADLGLETGAPFAVLRLGDGLILLPEQRRFEHLCEQVSAALAAGGITPEAMLKTLPEARNQVYARRYGGSENSKRAPRRKSGAHRGK